MTLAVALVAVVVGFGAWWTYFDLVGQCRPGPGRRSGLRWELGHLPLTAAIAAMGAAMISLTEHAHDGRTPAARPAPLVFGLALVLLLSIPWSIAVVRHLISEESPGQAGDHADSAVG